MEFEGGEIINKHTFFNHVFSSTEDGKAEIFNSIQYCILAIIPIVIINKLIQRFIPDPNLEKGSLEILFEIILQLCILIVGIILIHRIITYLPTYSGFKYENFTVTNSILTFMIIILSLQTKIGIKTSILYERMVDLWEGSGNENKKSQLKKIHTNNSSITGNIGSEGFHSHSQADSLDTPNNGSFPPLPIASSAPSKIVKPSDPQFVMPQEPLPANFSGSPFGTSY
jgi:hypothetical protein